MHTYVGMYYNITPLLAIKYKCLQLTEFKYSHMGCYAAAFFNQHMHNYYEQFTVQYNARPMMMIASV